MANVVTNLNEYRFATFMENLIMSNMKRLHEEGNCFDIPVGCVYCGEYDPDRSDLDYRRSLFEVGDLTP